MRPSTSVPAKKTSNFQNLNQNQFHKPPSAAGPKQITSTRGNLLVFSRNGPKPTGTKVAGIAAAPTPLNTPSLKSENSGKDILVNLVPVGSSGAVWTSEGKVDAAASTTSAPPSEKPPASRPAPWASRSGEEGSAPPPAPVSTSTPPTRSLKAMKNWADDDSESDTEDIAREQPVPSRAPPSQQQQQQQMSYPGHGDSQQYAPQSRYAAAPPISSGGPYGGQEPSRWQRGGGMADSGRGDEYYRGSRPVEEPYGRSGGGGPGYGMDRYNSRYGGGAGQEPAMSRYGLPSDNRRGGERGGLEYPRSDPWGGPAAGDHRYPGGSHDAMRRGGDMRGSGLRPDNRGDARGDVRGDARVRGGSFEQSEWGTRSYGGPRAVSPGVSGGMLSSSIGGADGGDGGLLEQQKALEMARVERDLVEQRKRQWEQQQRLAEQREREAREREQREREARATSAPAPAAGAGAPQSHYPPSQLQQFQPSSSPRGVYPPETHTVAGVGVEADTAVSWRRAAVPPASAVAPARAPLSATAATGTAPTASSAAAVNRPNPWGAKTLLSSTAESGGASSGEKLTSSSEHLRLQQGGVQLMHRPSQPQFGSGDTEGTRPGPHAGSSGRHGPHVLFDPKTGSYYEDSHHQKRPVASGPAEGVKEGEEREKPQREKTVERIKEREKEKEKEPRRKKTEDRQGSELSEARRAKDEEAVARKEERAREKASRPPRTQGWLFRYVDGKVGGPIERVMTSEEAARAAAEEKIKASAAEARQAERAGAAASAGSDSRSRRQQQRQEEVGKMQDLLRKNNAAAGTAPRRREERGAEKGEAGQTEASKTTAAVAAAVDTSPAVVPMTSGVMFAEPFIGRENTVVVMGGLGVDISESEALVEFTEVKSRRSKSQQQAALNAAAATAHSSQLARDKKRPPSAQAPPTKAVAAPAPSSSSVSPANAPTPARASPPTAVVAMGPPAKPAWSAPRATLAVIGGTAIPTEEEEQREQERERREERENKRLRNKKEGDRASEATRTPQKGAAPTAAAGVSSDRKKSAEKKSRSPATTPAAALAAGDQKKPASSFSGGRAAASHQRESAAAAVGSAPSSGSADRNNTSSMVPSSLSAEAGLALDSVSMDIHSVADNYPRRNMDSFQIFVPGKGLQASGLNSAADAATSTSTNNNGGGGSSGSGSWTTQNRVAYVGGPVQEPALFVPGGAHWSAVAGGADLHQFSEILGAQPATGPDRIISWQQDPAIHFMGVEPAITTLRAADPSGASALDGKGPTAAGGGGRNPSSSRLQSWSRPNNNNNNHSNHSSTATSGGVTSAPELTKTVDAATDFTRVLPSSSLSSSHQSSASRAPDPFSSSQPPAAGAGAAVNTTGLEMKRGNSTDFHDLEEQIIIHAGSDQPRSPLERSAGRGRGRGRESRAERAERAGGGRGRERLNSLLSGRGTVISAPGGKHARDAQRREETTQRIETQTEGAGQQQPPVLQSLSPSQPPSQSAAEEVPRSAGGRGRGGRATWGREGSRESGRSGRGRGGRSGRGGEEWSSTAQQTAGVAETAIPSAVAAVAAVVAPASHSSSRRRRDARSDDDSNSAGSGARGPSGGRGGRGAARGGAGGRAARGGRGRGGRDGRGRAAGRGGRFDESRGPPAVPS